LHKKGFLPEGEEMGDTAFATQVIPQSMQKLKSIDDIAKIANVSKSTVSRALNDSPLVNQATKDKILAIAKSHGFHCCSQARNLSTRTSKVIGFVNHAYCADSNGISDQFSLEIMGGITVGVHEMGYELMVIHVDPRDEGWVSQYLDSRKVDGFILMTSTRKMSHVDLLLRTGAPFIAWGIENKRFCTVLGDNMKGGELAAKRFVETGRRRPACIYGPRDEIEAADRQTSFEGTMTAAGIAIDSRLLRFGDYGEETGAKAAESLLASGIPFDSLFAASDLMAIGAIRVLRSRGIAIPKDVAVIGYDNLNLSSYITPALTTVSQSVPRAGKLLARDLITYLESGVVTATTVPVDLIIRESA
jgi:DNA-binding LacI/PurR family transcriptional regulator